MLSDVEMCISNLKWKRSLGTLERACHLPVSKPLSLGCRDHSAQSLIRTPWCWGDLSICASGSAYIYKTVLLSYSVEMIRQELGSKKKRNFFLSHSECTIHTQASELGKQRNFINQHVRQYLHVLCGYFKTYFVHQRIKENAIKSDVEC